jgi:hypothetical protein
MPPPSEEKALSVEQNPSDALPPQVFTCFPDLPAELRLVIWELAAAETQKPRVIFSDTLKPVASETHDSTIKALALTCQESYAATADYRRGCQSCASPGTLSTPGRENQRRQARLTVRPTPRRALPR